MEPENETQRSPAKPERYRRHVAFGLGHKGMKSREFERRDKRSFRRWMRRRGNNEGNE